MDKSKKLKIDEMNETQKSFMWLNLFYMLWTFVGLFTFQWPVFVLIHRVVAYQRNTYKICRSMD